MGEPSVWTADAGSFNWSSYRVNQQGLRVQAMDQTLDYTFEAVQQGAASLTVDHEAPPVLSPSGAVIIDRGPVLERYEIRNGGVEQLFEIRELPGTGDLVVTGTVAGETFDPARSNEQHLSFGATLTVTKAIAYDAAGSQQALAMSVQDGVLKITVPEAWLSSAVLPITVDPFFLTATPIATPTPAGDAPLPRPLAMVYNEEEDEFFVVYNFLPALFVAVGDMDIFARRINAATGATIGDPLPIDAVPGSDSRMPDVAWNSVNNTYMVVWQDQPFPTPANSVFHIRGRVFNVDGTPLSPVEFDVSQLTLNFIENDPCIEFDGTNFCVAWSRTTLAGPAGLGAQFNLHAQRLSPGGGWLTPTINIDLSVQDARRPSICYLGGAANVYLVAWSMAAAPAAAGTVFVTPIAPNASFPGGQFACSSAAALDHDNPEIAANLTAQEALVVWDSGTSRGNNPFNSNPGSTEINYRRVGSAGVPQGAAQSNLVTGAANVVLPDVAWCEQDNEYVIVYADGQGVGTTPANDIAVRAARVSAGGAVVESNLLGAQNAGMDQTAPVIVSRGDTVQSRASWMRLTGTPLVFSFHSRGFVTSGPVPGGGVGEPDNDNGNQGINDLFCGAASAGSLTALLAVGLALLFLARRASA